MRGRLERLHNGVRFFTDTGEGDAEENGEEQHLENIARRKRPNHGLRNDIEEEPHQSLIMCAGDISRDHLAIETRGINIKTRTRLDQIPSHQTDHKRKRGEG